MVFFINVEQQCIIQLVFLPFLIYISPLTPFTTFFLLFFTGYIARHVFLHYVYFPYLSPLKDMPTAHRWAWDGIMELAYAPQLKHHLQFGPGPVRWIVCFPFAEEGISINDPKGLSELLVTKGYDFEKPPKARGFLMRYLGNGLLCSEGDTHRLQKKLLTPAFSYARTRNLIPIFQDKVHIMCNVWMDLIRQSPNHSSIVDVYYQIGRATLDIIGLAGFGYDFDSLRRDSYLGTLFYNTYTAHGISREFQFGMFMSLLFGEVGFRMPIKSNRNAWKLRVDIERISRDLIERVKAGGKAADSKDILTIMYKEAIEQGLAPDDIETEAIHQCMTFLAAGHETTSTSTMWACYFLAKPQHRHMQERLRKEVQTIWKRNADGSLTYPNYDQIESLKYLNNFCKESIRFRPPVPASVRWATKDNTLGGYFVRKGTIIAVCPAAVNADPTQWGPDANVFDPDRFDNLPPHFSNYSNMSFFAGVRACIGQKFAYGEMKCILGEILSRFDLVYEGPEVVLNSNIVTRPQDGKMNIRITPLK